MTVEKGRIIIAALAVLMATACSGAANRDANATDGNAVAGTDVSASSSTGVAECDRLYDEIEKCIANDVPAGQKDAMSAAFKQSKEQIAKMAAGGNPDLVAKSCEAQGPQLKQQYCPK